MLLGMTLLIYTVRNTPSGISSCITSGKDPISHRPIFQVATLHIVVGSFWFSCIIVMFYLLQMSSAFLVLSIKMLPIWNWAVRHRFNACQWRVLLVYLLVTANWLERELWIHPFCHNAYTKGEFFLMHPDLRKYPAKFFCTYCMTIQQLDNLLHLLKPVISKQMKITMKVSLQKSSLS